MEDAVILDEATSGDGMKVLATNSTTSGWKLNIVHVNSSGVQSYSVLKTFSEWVRLTEAKKTASGYVAAGSFNFSQGLALKIRDNFSLAWSEKYSEVGGEGFNDVAVSGSRYLFGGQTDTDLNWQTVLFSSEGNIIRSRYYPGTFVMNTLSDIGNKFIHGGKDHLVATVQENTAYFSIDDLKTPESIVRKPSNFTVNATLENTGTASATRQISVRIGGEKVVSTSLKMNPGESKAFMWEFNSTNFSEGNLAVGINSRDDKASSSVTIVPNNYTRPEAEINYSPDTLDIDNVFNFSAYGSNAFNSIQEFIWNFGGKKKEGASVNHSFGSTGEKNVTLTVEDSYGVRNTTSKILDLKDFEAKFNITGFEFPQKVRKGENVFFNLTVKNYGTSNGTALVEFGVKIDKSFYKIVHERTRKIEAGRDKSFSFNHIFNTTGNQTVMITAIKNNSIQHSVKTTVEVLNKSDQRPTAGFSYRPQEPFAVADTVVFNASTSTDPNGDQLNYTWTVSKGGATFGNHTGVLFNRSFVESGTWTVTLEVTDGNQTDKVAKNVTVGSPFTITRFKVAENPNPNEKVLFNITIRNKGVNETGVAALLKVGSSDYARKTKQIPSGESRKYQINHTFDSTGLKNMSAQAIWETHNIDKEYLTVNVTERPNQEPTANFTYQDYNLYTGNEINFNGSASYDPDGQISTYQWSIGNRTLTGKMVSHVFDQAGTYNVSLQVSDGLKIDSISRNITINPIARFNITEFKVPQKAEEREKVQVNVTVENYGTGGSNPIVTFEVNGTEVYVTDNKDIGAGEDKTFQLDYSFNSSALYQVAVYVNRGTGKPQDDATQVINVTDRSQADFNILSVIATEEPVPDEPVSFTAKVRNNGSETGNVSLLVRDQDSEMDEIVEERLHPGSTKEFSFNETFGRKGVYNLTLVAQKDSTDGTEDAESIVVEVGQASDAVRVDDFLMNTSSELSTPAAFLGHELEIRNGEGLYTLVGPSGAVKASANESKNQSISTSGLSEGRYRVNSTFGNVTEIYLFSAASDMVGRVYNFTNPSVRFYTYMNAERVRPGQTDRLNYSGISSWEGNTSVFRVNTSLEGLWVEISGDEKTVVRASRHVRGGLEDCQEGCYLNRSAIGVQESFVQDFRPEESFNISGRVLNSSGSPVSGLQVVVKSIEGYEENREPRKPFRFAPPNFTVITGSSGKFSLEVPEGDYRLKIGNESWKRLGTPERPDASVFEDGMHNITVKATNKTGVVNVSVSTQQGYYYGVSAYRSGQSYRSYRQIGIGNGTNLTLPSGVYDIGIYRVSKENLDYSFKDLGTVNLSTGGVVSRSADFKPKVKLNGTVKAGSDTVSDVYISIQSDSGERYYSAETGENGHYSVKVAANTNYQMTVYPPYRSSYFQKSKSFNTSTGSKTVNISLSRGETLTGKIKNSEGEGVAAEITVYNFSKDIYTEEETRNGSYSIGGLENGSYSVKIEPKKPRLSPVSTTVQINASDNARNFTLQSSTVYLNGTVTVEGDRPPLRVTVSGQERASTVLNASTGFSFKVPDNSYYEISVRPIEGVNSGLKPITRQRYVSGDTSLNFTLSRPEKISGVVETDSGNALTNAYVYAYNYSKSSFATDTTGENGRYSLQLDPVDHKVRVMPKSLPSKTFNISGSKIDNETATKDFTFDTSTVTYLEGNVTANGQPVEGWISVWNESSRSYAYQRLENGQFNLTGLRNVSHKVWISAMNESVKNMKTTVSTSELGGRKQFQLQVQTTTKDLVVQVHEENPSGPLEPNVTVATSSVKKQTGPNGTVRFNSLTPGTNVTVYLNKDGFRSKIKEVEMRGLTSGDVRTADIGLDRVQEYSVKLNVSKPGNGTEISPPASVIFVSRRNGSAESDSVTVNTESARPSLEGLTSGNYTVTVTTGPDTTYVNETAEIPVDGGGFSETLNMTSSTGTEFRVWYEVQSR
ncbi:MAG: PKD domain-containing protein [Candidatus Nanohaloarchaea archaeon]